MARGGGGDAPIYRKNRKIKDLTPDPSLDLYPSSVVYYRYYRIIAVFDNILNFDINRL
jgi:hypothetical protein